MFREERGCPRDRDALGLTCHGTMRYHTSIHVFPDFQMSTWVGVFGQWRRSWYWKHGGLGVNTERRVLDVTWHYLSSGGYTPGYDRKMTGRTH